MQLREREANPGERGPARGVMRLIGRMSVAVVPALAVGCHPPAGVSRVGSGATGLERDTPPITEGDWYRPDVDATWQWQLQPDADGKLNTDYDVDVYDLDLLETGTDTIDSLRTQGARVLCYFSAGSFEDFRPDAARFLSAELGNALEGFADERWLDIRSSNVRAIMLDRLDLAVQKGCDGVEPDNVTGFQNDTGFDLTADDQLAFNRFIANETHRRGLAVALKNDLDQIRELVDYYDLSINEQCHEFDECAMLEPFVAAGKPVFNAEYADPFVNDPTARQPLCTAALNERIRTLVLPLDLDDSFRFTCDP